MKPDAIARRIRRVLQEDGRGPNNELARRARLSPSPCLRRMRMLEKVALSKGYVAVVNPAKAGFGVTVFVRLWLTGEDDLPGLKYFESEHLARIKGVRSMKTDIPLLKAKNASFA
ncbi:Lrp/AsnC family transcriptional regulator [Komagataeibacter oboediens]|uniref:AsnC family transcriptional regulator n=1 Tax=Komagataeibacter oboediens TaxID=65958 RepID=A0ABS5SNP9_9PROT|nr:winged helix-turn-helix transcriptional regulator [Komagataeibacter oboediens]MBL7234538.1 AsnC family transcriptional regulator [Komagataeibacter oboediens]MBT0675110.1 AsnC family transcriptional regulator [Komagataeibacter oboediens]MBT0678352.1 AsnC family transcriptional regulator [Komagataeibacter oboediens]